MDVGDLGVRGQELARRAYAHPRDELGQAECREVAGVIVFLASDAASNVSGAIVPVDNGWSAV